MAYKKIIYKDKPAKLEVFNKNHKLFKSLPVHRKALELGLRVPKLYNVEEKHGRIYKTTEWIEGNTIHDEMETNTNMIEIICADLSKYVNELFNASSIAAVDNHFKNFVWNNNSVVYIDLKKLLYETYEEHIMRMSKICLKNCRGKHRRRKAVAFLKGYAKYGNVNHVVFECEKRNWAWQDREDMEPIMLGEII
jgi:tRNA A-37 threonylcarbamoyl transferase component Bud32